MTSGMIAPPVPADASAGPPAQQAIPVSSTARSLAQSRRDLVIVVAAYGVS
jgi:hypothetical protein